MRYSTPETRVACFKEDVPGTLCHDYCFFMRHGETHWNRERRIMGRTDIPLNETGIYQAYETQQYVKDLGIQTICTSPLQRARQTADILNETLKVPMTEIANLKEFGWGDHEGQIQMRLKGPMMEEAKQGLQSGTAESYETFEERIICGFKEAIHNPGPVLIVSHGGVFWALATFFNWPVEKLLSNCELLQIYFPRVHGEWVIRKITLTQT